MPICTKCKISKSFDEMSLDRSRKNGISSWCKVCRKESSRTWYSLNTDRLNKLSKKRPSYEKQRAYMLKHRYNLVGSDYEDIKKSQNNCCALCGKDSTVMTYHMHVDHCHTTNVVRGLLCAPCNAFLGYIKDNPEILYRAVNYLNEHKKKTKKEQSET